MRKEQSQDMSPGLLTAPITQLLPWRGLQPRAELCTGTIFPNPPPGILTGRLPGLGMAWSK